MADLTAHIAELQSHLSSLPNENKDILKSFIGGVHELTLEPLSAEEHSPIPSPIDISGVALDTVVPCSDQSMNRGVDVDWLRGWTSKHNLWQMKTEDVVEMIIKPLTAHHQCRFVELGSQVTAHPECVGKADCFVSHCWQNPFGNLVAAVCDNSRPGRRVWIDIFAVNQHEVSTMTADLGQLCEVIANTDEGIMLCLDAATALDNSRYNPLRRIWCVFEVFHGLMNEKPLVLKLGRAEAQSEMTWQWKREWEHEQVQSLAQSVDVLRAESTKDDDKERIIAALSMSGTSGTGVESVNGRLTTAVWNAYTTRGQSAFHYAVQGAKELGWAVQNCGVDLEAKNPEGWTALHSAAYSGQHRIVAALLHPVYEQQAVGEEDEWLVVKKKKKQPPGQVLRGANVNAQDGKGRTPSFSAAWQGNLNCIKMLVEAGADLTLMDAYGLRPIDRARRCHKNGKRNKELRDELARYKEVVDYLEQVMTLDGTLLLPESPELKRSMSNSSTNSSGSAGGGTYYRINLEGSRQRGKAKERKDEAQGKSGGKGGHGKSKGNGKGADVNKNNRR